MLPSHPSVPLHCRVQLYEAQIFNIRSGKKICTGIPCALILPEWLVASRQHLPAPQPMFSDCYTFIYCREQGLGYSNRQNPPASWVSQPRSSRFISSPLRLLFMRTKPRKHHKSLTSPASVCVCTQRVSKSTGEHGQISCGKWS